VKNFKPETFWGIKVMHVQERKKVNFLWRRVHLFDRAAVTVMLERCLLAKTAKVTKVNQKPTSKWRPLPLTTVDLQMMGSRYLRMDSSAVMKVCRVNNIFNISSGGLQDSGSRISLYQRLHQLSSY
jgi:DNA topoisomerase-3